MSEPSPEAKQAAVDWDKARNKDVDGFPTIIEAFAYGYDTATAKAREELEYWQGRANNLRSLLTHQQPSAITTNEQAYRDGTLSQPSAPTADDSWCGCTNQNRDPKCKIHN